MREDQIDQAERRATLENDRLVREQQQRGSTFHQHAQSAANDTGGGRFASLGAPHVVGSEPAARYPAAGAHQCDPTGPEPALGFSVDDMPALANPADVPVSPSAETGGAEAPSKSPPPSSGLSEHAAPPSSSEQMNE
jgi:hypothetical protein